MTRLVAAWKFSLENSNLSLGGAYLLAGYILAAMLNLPLFSPNWLICVIFWGIPVGVIALFAVAVLTTPKV